MAVMKYILSKLEPEFVPTSEMFGLTDVGARAELIDVMKKAGVKNACFFYPEHAERQKDAKLVTKTMEMAADFADAGFDLTLAGVEDVKKLHTLEMFKRVNGIKNNKPVEDKCRREGVQYVPTVSNQAEIDSRSHWGTKLVKAYPWVRQDGTGMHEKVEDYKGDMKFGIAGGVKPIENTDADLWTLNMDVVTAAALPQVSLITATQPTKLLVGDEPLRGLETYLDMLKEF